MRTDNRQVKNTVVTIYLILIIFAVLSATVIKSLEFVKDISFFVFLGLFIVLIIFHSIAGYFEYDSDGPNIMIINKGLLLTDYINYREKAIEFAREDLLGFKVKNFIIYKSLVVFYKTKTKNKAKRRFNVTLLKYKKLKYVKQSLTKTLKKNKKLSQQV